MRKHDEMRIEILEDGTIRTTTDGVSQANHQNAEAFLRFVAQMTGGRSARARRKEAQHHHHHHQDGGREHDHERQ